MTTKQKTISQIYDENHKNLMNKMKRIEKILEDEKEKAQKAEKKGIDFGYIGNLTYVEEKLTQVEQFLTNTQP